MTNLTAAECRVLGVLVEKAHTSSAYPMSLNAIVDGCNQKSNREPVVNYDEDRVMAALDGLRTKGLVVFADTLGSRVTKFRHLAREVLGVANPELVILVEMLLRGPQTAAELRMRASRMQQLEAADVQDALQKLMDRPEPLARRLPGGRAERFAQLLCPSLHPLDEAPGESSQPSSGESEAAATSLAGRVAALEEELAQLRGIIQRLARALGEEDVLGAPARRDPQNGNT